MTRLSDAAKRRLGLLLRIAVAIGAVAFLARALQWNDRVRVAGPGPELTGVELRVEAGKTELVRQDGSAVELTSDQAARAQVVPGVRTTLERASPAALLLTLLLYVLGLSAVGVRWWSLLRLMGIDVAASRCWRGVFQGQTVGLILPGSVGGDVYRVAAVAQAGVPLVEGTLSILLDRLVGLWTMALLSGGLALASGTSGLGSLATLLVAGAVLAVPLAALVSPLSKLLPARLRDWRPVSAVQAFVARARSTPRRIWLPLVLSAANTALQVGCLLVLVADFWRAPSDLGGAVAAVAIGFMVNALPASPGGIGVGEAAFVWLLGKAGAPAAPVLAAAVTYRLITYVVAVLAAALFLRRERAAQPADGGAPQA